MPAEERPGARIFEPMPGRPMREYVEVPAAMLGNVEELSAWMRRALEYGASLPAKKKAAAKKAPAKKTAATKAAATKKAPAKKASSKKASAKKASAR